MITITIYNEQIVTLILPVVFGIPHVLGVAILSKCFRGCAPSTPAVIIRPELSVFHKWSPSFLCFHSVLPRHNIPKAYFDVVLSPRIPSFSSVSVGWLLCIGYEQKIALFEWLKIILQIKFCYQRFLAVPSFCKAFNILMVTFLKVKKPF